MAAVEVPFNRLAADPGQRAAWLAAIARVVASGRFVLGDEVARFEEEFASYCGVRHCVGVANGTDALELALRALGAGPGDEVVVAANAGMYATLAALACGARPVFADVDRRTLTLARATIEAAAGPRTKAVVVTHLYGRLAAIEDIAAWGLRSGAAVIEDAAQAHGATTGGRRAGSFGAVGCFSFYPTKNLGALGDGGAVVTSDPALAAKIRALRQYGWGAKYQTVVPGGRNSRLDELQAAVLRSRLAGLDADNDRRRAVARAYGAGIVHPAIALPPPAGAGDVAHLYVVRTPHRESLRRHLAAARIGTAVHFPVPDHRQPTLAAAHAHVTLPVAEAACGEVLSLPCFPGLEEHELAHVIDRCNDWQAPR